MKTKEAMEIAKPIEISENFVKKQNLSFRLAWWIQWWPNFDMQFFSLSLNNFFFRCLVVINNKKTQNKQTNRQPQTNHWFLHVQLLLFFLQKQNPFWYSIDCMALSWKKRPNKKCDWNEQVSKEKLPIGLKWVNIIIQWNKKKEKETKMNWK